MSPDALKTLIDIGGQAILLFLLWQVWQRLNVVTDKLIGLTNQLHQDALERRLNAQAAQQKRD